MTIPNVHLQRGATAVAYSGGKCIRGPQSAGLLLGEKNLLKAAWANSAPHHAFGRSLKVGKEEIMGMLAGVEMWKKRDHNAEWRQWQGWLDEISASVKKVNGVTTHVDAPKGLSNRSPRLMIEWDGAQVGITGEELGKFLFETEPRIAMGRAKGSRPDEMASSISITPYMMMPGDSKIVARRLYEVLSKPPKFETPALPQGEPAIVAGQWQVVIEFGRGSATHTLILEQQGAKLIGTHRGEVWGGRSERPSSGQLDSIPQLAEDSRYAAIYDFTRTVDGDKMTGNVSLGEYGEARWSAQRHQYRLPRGEVRPVKPV